MKRSAGFSLLEVLIAFAVMALVLSALIPGQARLLERTNTAKVELLAYDYALSRLSELGISVPVEVDITQDTYQDWTILITTEPTSSPDPDVPLVMVTAVISTNADRALATAKTVKVLP